jgi:hypothetical protein
MILISGDVKITNIKILVSGDAKTSDQMCIAYCILNLNSRETDNSSLSKKTIEEVSLYSP